MTDIPVIFSAPMVQALLREARNPGTGKTMTRRLAWRELEPKAKPGRLHRAAKIDLRTGKTVVATPWQKVKPGDRLWVRENMRVDTQRETLAYMADDKTVPKGSFAWDSWLRAHGTKSIPSIHMPRWASRLVITVTATKIEPLQAISEADARAEGVVVVPGQSQFLSCREGFELLWGSLHGHQAWIANPEVVALSGRVEERNIDQRRAA